MGGVTYGFNYNGLVGMKGLLIIDYVLRFELDLWVWVYLLHFNV